MRIDSKTKVNVRWFLKRPVQAFHPDCGSPFPLLDFIHFLALYWQSHRKASTQSDANTYPLQLAN
ncbi:hypothetical protein Ahy_A10g051177 isoform C [Arachis hypogaea]|nr:hypothetical protein Ahy_A10g051177 isoform C [Arachis hypogaea]